MRLYNIATEDSRERAVISINTVVVQLPQQ